MNKLISYTIIAVSVLIPTFLFAYTGGWLTPGRLTPNKFLNQFHADGARYPGYRSNHAQGICISGYFVSNGNAEPYSVAQVFKKGEITPVIGRFSIPGPNLKASDASMPVRAMALLFKQADGQQWRTAMLNAPAFSTSTPASFYDLIRAQQPNRKTGKPDGKNIAKFKLEHPESKYFFNWMAATQPSKSFATQSYNSLDTFYLTNASGAKAKVRWAFKSLNSNAPSIPDLQSHPYFLLDELPLALQRGPLRWQLVFTVGTKSDPSLAAVPWPKSLPKVTAGTLFITGYSSQDTGACKDVNFDPTVLPYGMSISSDPLLPARSAVYSASYLLRTSQELGVPLARTVLWPSAQ